MAQPAIPATGINPLGRHDAWLGDCDGFATNPCTTAQKEFFETLGREMGFTDFRPATVNWAHPVSWRGSGGCTLSNQDGCIMPIATGYAIVLGFGAFFSILTIILNWFDKKATGVVDTSESFNTAGRNIKIGLTGSVIVSQWTWAATLLQSSNVAWNQGISGPFWYAAGATIQVLLFGILAIEVKRKCPNAHTFLEFIDARWGTVAHMTFLIFAFFTNFLVTGMLLLGGSAVMNAASGMDKVLCSFLIPWFSFVLYTLVGGLKATFMAGYIHTSIIMAGLCVFVTSVYCLEGDLLGGPDGAPCVATEQCNAIGSAGAMWERLSFVVELGKHPDGTFFSQSAHLPPSPPPPPTGAMSPPPPPPITSNCTSSPFNKFGPVAENKGGSYLTMMSTGGTIFGVINTVGNFGTVFVDQSYWQSAIAASPASAHKGYMLGGLTWFAIPFALATSLGLAAIAMNVDLLPSDAGAGLVPPAAATALVGKGGGVLTIVMLFMALTSTGSAECIAVGSLVTYDVYRRYFNPEATGAQILFVSRVCVGVFGLVMGTVAAIFNSFEIEILKTDDDCNWYNPCAAAGDRTNDDGNPIENLSMGWVYVFMGNMIGSAVIPVAMAITWKDCTACAAICGAWGGLFGSIISWCITASVMYCEANYYSLSTNIPLLVGNLVAILFSGLLCFVISKIQGGQNYDWAEMNKAIKLVENDKFDIPEWELSEEFLSQALAWSIKVGGGLSIFLVIIWPIFIAFPLGVFPKGTWAIWSGVAFMWGWIGTIVIISLPILENWDTITKSITCNFAASANPTAKASSTESTSSGSSA